jgi:polyhydroxyalkanoate synthesis repressor PhaR
VRIPASRPAPISAATAACTWAESDLPAGPSCLAGCLAGLDWPTRSPSGRLAAGRSPLIWLQFAAPAWRAGWVLRAAADATVKRGRPAMAAVRLIKKYPNRRLYDTQTSSYITLSDVKQLVLDQEEFKVVDAKSSEDLTRQILMQIILEEEQEGQPMFTPPVLSQIIRSYGNAMQGMMGSYLEKNVQAFVDIQNKLQEQSKAFYDSNKVGPEMWTQFVNMQGPMLQSMMSSYIEQSKDLFMQMQENMSKQARSMFTGFQFPAEKK